MYILGLHKVFYLWDTSAIAKRIDGYTAKCKQTRFCTVIGFCPQALSTVLTPSWFNKEQAIVSPSSKWTTWTVLEHYGAPEIPYHFGKIIYYWHMLLFYGHEMNMFISWPLNVSKVYSMITSPLCQPASKRLANRLQPYVPADRLVIHVHVERKYTHNTN